MRSRSSPIVTLTDPRIADCIGLSIAYAGKSKSFPIASPADVSNAASTISRASADNYDATTLKANIKAIARKRGAAYIAQLPKAWREELFVAGLPAAARHVLKMHDASRAEYVAGRATGAINLNTEADQRVSIKDDEVWHDSQKGVAFTIGETFGEGGDTFCSLIAPDGSICEWFRVDELQPAPAAWIAPIAAPGSPRLGKPRKRAKARIGKPRATDMPSTSDAATTTLMSLASTEQMTEPELSLRDAIKRVSARRPDLAASYFEATDAGPRDHTARPLSLAERAQAADVVMRLQQVSDAIETAAREIQTTRRCPWPDAVCAVSVDRPDLWAEYHELRNQGRR